MNHSPNRWGRLRITGMLILVVQGLAGCQPPTPTPHPPVGSGAPTPTALPWPVRSSPEPWPPTDPDDAWKTNWLRNDPCASPCVEGLTPGLTTYAETAAILEQHPNLDQHYPYMGGWVGKSSRDVVALSVEFATTSPVSTTRIAKITLGVDSVPLQALLETFGEPSAIVASQGDYWVHGGNPDQNPQVQRWYSLRVLYHEAGFMIAARTDRPTDKPVLTTTLLLTTPTFFDPTTDYTAALQYTPALITPWHGWDSFDGYCRESMRPDHACQP